MMKVLTMVIVALGFSSMTPVPTVRGHAFLITDGKAHHLGQSFRRIFRHPERAPEWRVCLTWSDTGQRRVNQSKPCDVLPMLRGKRIADHVANVVGHQC